MAQIRPLLVATLILAGGCDRRPDQPPEPAAASVPKLAKSPALADKLDTSGYYEPTREVKVGVYQLDYLQIGTDSPSRTWEKERPGIYAPITLQFGDTTTPLTTTRLGRAARTHVEKIRPDSWKVTDTELQFVDDQYRLGKVSFSGRIDRTALAAAKAGKPDRPAISGTLTVGDQTFKNVGFQWFAGP